MENLSSTFSGASRRKGGRIDVSRHDFPHVGPHELVRLASGIAPLIARLTHEIGDHRNAPEQARDQSDAVRRVVGVRQRAGEGVEAIDADSPVGIAVFEQHAVTGEILH